MCTVYEVERLIRRKEDNKEGVCVVVASNKGREITSLMGMAPGIYGRSDLRLNMEKLKHPKNGSDEPARDQARWMQ